MKPLVTFLCQLAVFSVCLILPSNQVCAQSSIVTLNENLAVYPRDMGNMTYLEALKVCKALNTSKSYGFSDWRLPTLSELKLLTSNAGKVKGILSKKRYGSLEGILDLKDQTVDRNLDWKERVFTLRPVRTDEVPVVSEDPIELKVSPFEVNFEQEGGSQIMVIITNAENWSIKSYPDWCSIFSQTATTFVLNGHVNNGSERTGELVVLAGSEETKTQINQKGIKVQTQVVETYSPLPQPVAVKEVIETPLSQGKWRDIITANLTTGVTKSNPTGNYKGQTEKNRREGLGIFLWRNDTMYLGNWESFYGTKNGLGIYIPPVGYETDNCVDCSYFVGDWDLDIRSGRGTCYDMNGNLLYKGGFAKDRPTDNYPSEGDYSAYKFEYIQLADGSSYLGETFNNQPEGLGATLYAGGDIWLGKWKDGKHFGQGALITLDGNVVAQ
jgi:hypothetical protein